MAKREQIQSLACYFFSQFLGHLHHTKRFDSKQRLHVPVISQRLDCHPATTGRQRRFALKWASYQAGFGDSAGTFWLGLERMNQLTFYAQYRLRVEIQSDDKGKWASAEYASFRISSSTNGYAISLSGYVGDSGDGFQDPRSNINGMKFTTIDVDNDLSPRNCAVDRGGGGWWYNYCHVANLNSPVGSVEFCWMPLAEKGIASTSHLQKSRMMIKMV